MSENEDKTTTEDCEATGGGGEGQAPETEADQDDTANEATDQETDAAEAAKAEPEEDTGVNEGEAEPASEQDAAEEQPAEEGDQQEEGEQQPEKSEEQPEEGEEQPAPPQKIATSPLTLAITSLVDEKQSLRDRWLRTAADFENYKKRARRDIVERAKQAEDRMILDFLPVVDNLERALEHGEKSEGPLLDGVNMVYKQFLSTLERYGITPCEALGQAFDPEFHEAIQQMHSDLPAGTVCAVLQRGYRRRERLVRAALAVVSLGPAEVKAEEPEEAEEAAPEEAVEGAVEETAEGAVEETTEEAVEETTEEAVEESAEAATEEATEETASEADVESGKTDTPGEPAEGEQAAEPEDTGESDEAENEE